MDYMYSLFYKLNRFLPKNYTTVLTLLKLYTDNLTVMIHEQPATLTNILAFTQHKIFRSYMNSLPLKPRAKLKTQDRKWKGVLQCNILYTLSIFRYKSIVCSQFILWLSITQDTIMLKYCVSEGWIPKGWEKVTANSSICNGVLMKNITSLNQHSQEPCLY
jgi:hypothetical protein